MKYLIIIFLFIVTSCSKKEETPEDPVISVLMDDLYRSAKILKKNNHRSREYLRTNKIDTMEVLRLEQVSDDYTFYLKVMMTKFYSKKLTSDENDEIKIYQSYLEEDKDFINKRFFKSEEWGDYTEKGEELLYKTMLLKDYLVELAHSQSLKDKIEITLALYDARYEHDLEKETFDHKFRDLTKSGAILYFNYLINNVLELESDILEEMYINSLKKQPIKPKNDTDFNSSKI